MKNPAVMILALAVLAFPYQLLADEAMTPPIHCPLHQEKVAKPVDEEMTEPNPPLVSCREAMIPKDLSPEAAKMHALEDLTPEPAKTKADSAG